jgi:hypothetical protein
MPRITNRMITDRWIEAFEKGKPFTPSEKRMMGIKLAQLKKNIKKHIEATGRITDLSVEQIIVDALEFSVMTNKPYRSIASLGYEILDPSLDYWEKRRKLEEAKEDQRPEPVQESSHYTDKQETTKEEVMKESHNENNSPAWMNIDEW